MPPDPRAPKPSSSEPVRLVDVEAMVRLGIVQERRRLGAAIRAAAGRAPILYRSTIKAHLDSLALDVEGRGV